MIVTPSSDNVDEYGQDIVLDLINDAIITNGMSSVLVGQIPHIAHKSTNYLRQIISDLDRTDYITLPKPHHAQNPSPIGPSLRLHCQ
jgi:hypothetical protein